VVFDFADIVTFTAVFELLFFIIFILFKSFKPYYNRILLIFFACQALGIVSWIFRKHHLQDEISNILLVFDLFWAPSLFLYAEALTKKREKPGIYFFYHALLFLIFLIYSLIQLVFTLPSPPISIIINTQVIVYNIAGLIILTQYHRKVKENFSKDESKIRSWVVFAIVGYALACFIPTITYYLGIYQVQSSMIKEVIAYFPFLVFYNILFFNAVGNPVIIHEIPKGERYQNSNLTDEQANKFLKKLDKVVESGKCYLEPELTLNSLSEMSEIPSRYLSQIINQYKQKSFYDYINGLRVEYACKELQADSNKTILEILYESGFNSKTSFNTSFKKHTRLTPSQFKEKTKKNSSDS